MQSYRSTQSPIAVMQRQLGHSDPMAGLGRLGAGLALAGFGNTLTQSAVTGVKSGTTAATVSTAIGTGVASAIGAGAAAGSFIPIIGTAIGAIVGLIASGVFNHRVDPEVGNFNNAMALVRQSGPQAVFNIADKYLVLAGLFDLLPGQIKGNIPIYKKYGRMGEQKFVQDMMNRIYAAGQSGAIGPNDTPQSVMAKVVQPWIDSFGLGPMQDSNTEMINNILTGMIAEYVTGLWKTRWYARAGDFPNWQIPVFSLPSGAGVAPGTSGTPTQVSAPPSSGLTPTGANSPYGPVYQRSGDPSLYVMYQGAPMVYTAPAGSVPAVPQSSIATPSGFSVVASDAASGAPLYAGPDGRYYSWNGVTMTPFSGTLSANGQLVGAQSGVLVPTQSGTLQTPSQPFAPQQPYNPMLFGPPTGQSPTIITVPGTAPTQSAGVMGTGLPSWVTWGAMGGVVLLLLATARPMQGGSYKRARR